jgi:HD-like signal output (HDOD) protein/GGDEF domain-containing protein
MSDPNTTLDRLVAKAGHLYSLPTVAVKVLELTSNLQVDTHALKACIENDPALTTKILKVVNSSLFGLSREVSDLNQALTLLGTKPLKLLVLGFSLPEGLLLGVTADVLDRYWRHTLTKAVAGREISENFWRQPGDDAFIAGLLQDLGMLLLIQVVGEPYARFLRRVEASGRDLIALEIETMGFDHTALTARLLAHWGLPDSLIRNVAWSDVHQAIEDPSRSAASLPRILHLAELTARLVSGGQPEILSDLLAAGRQYRDLSQAQLEALVADLEEKVRQLADVLRLELPAGRDYREVLVEAHLRLAEVAAETAGDLLGQSCPQRREPPDNPRLNDEMLLLSRAIAQVSRQASGAADRSRPTVSDPVGPVSPQAAGHGVVSASNVVAAESAPAPWLSRSAVEEPDPGLLGQLASAVNVCRQARCSLSLLLIELNRADELAVILGIDGLEALRRLLEQTCQGVDHPGALCVPQGELGFAVILPDCDRQMAVRLGSQLLDHLRRIPAGRPVGGRQPLHVGVGAATVALPPKNFLPVDLFDAASHCLYGSHASGGGVVKSIEIY